MDNNLLKKFIDLLIVVLYLGVWTGFVLISKKLGFINKPDSSIFLTLSFLVMFFGMITKSTSWSIGNKFFNITGDSKRHIEYSSHKNWKNSNNQKTGFTVKIDHDDPEAIKKLMTHHKKLEKNP